MIATISEIYVAGTSTVSTALTFAVLYLVKHVEVQVKLFLEIHDVVGSIRNLTLNDRSR